MNSRHSRRKISVGNHPTECHMNVTDKDRTEIEAAVFRRLLQHFDERKDVQNIDLMILAGFCRNCLSKWYAKAAKDRGLEVDLEEAREKVYGMPYSEWKAKYQREASEDQIARFNASQDTAQT